MTQRFIAMEDGLMLMTTVPTEKGASDGRIKALPILRENADNRRL